MDITQLDAQITELRKQVEDAQRDITNAQASVDGWVNAQAQDAANQASFETVQNTNAQLASARQRLAEAQRRLEYAKADLANKLELREAIEAAATDAIKRGVSPDQAYALAQAEVLAQQRKTKLLNAALLVGGIILIIVVLVWAWKKYRS
jgi:predicted nuclease with TOPRIM domain